MIRKEKLEELESYVQELKTIKTSILKNSDGKGFMSIAKVECLLNNGKTIIREQLLKNNGDSSAVIMLPVTKDNNIVLVVQPRVLTKTTVGIELPAGYIEKGEDPVKAGLRELKEETGYESNNTIRLAEFYQDQGCSRAYNSAFIALDCVKTSKQELDKDEYIRYFECQYDEALELMELGYINDSNSIITLEKSRKYMKGR